MDKIFVFIIIIMVNTNVYAKYAIEYTNTIAKINIDKTPPKIEIISIENSNLLHTNTANRTDTIKIKIQVIENNIKENNFNKNKIEIYVEDKQVFPEDYQISQLAEKDKIIYEISLSKILENGKLKIKIPKGTISDIYDNVNQEKIIDTNITIDNITPTITIKF